MKKLFLIAAVAGVAFAGCAKIGKDLSVTQNEREIVFNAPIMSHATTKANVPGAIEGTRYPDGENFIVAAWHTQEQLTATTESATMYVNPTEVTQFDYNNGTDGYKGWHATPAIYWPKFGYLSFSAYSPAKMDNTAANNISFDFKKGLTVNGFEVKPLDDYNYVDFLYSSRSINKKYSDQISDENAYYDGVDINFKHALSAIRFAALMANDFKAKIKVTKITVKNAYSWANFNENLTNPADVDDNAEWTGHANPTDYVVFDNSDGKVIEYQEPAAWTVLGGTTILIPQEFNTNSTKIVIEYTQQLLDNDGNYRGEAVKQTKELDLTSDEHVSGDTKIAEWLKGHRYNYYMTFSLDEIVFAPSVEEWTEVNSFITVQ